jgi:hypothetical protein
MLGVQDEFMPCRSLSFYIDSTYAVASEDIGCPPLECDLCRGRLYGVNFSLIFRCLVDMQV